MPGITQQPEHVIVSKIIEHGKRIRNLETQGIIVSEGSVTPSALFKTDKYEVSDITQVTFELSNLPDTDALAVFQNGLMLDSTEWSLVGQTITLLTTLTAGDTFLMFYAY
jgi:hypothetical protein